ncbi:DNA polymerase zeta subunit [Apostasia shenzhenica]|uniref:DNA polymerase zeta subunit n=1 Tax=Apostasia shenzhenica TaxID=1088818 RepID=A0A2I0B9I8_9ASPA|nr:DNA polymerase zeta subunit [Apostasia shenzhenica]
MSGPRILLSHRLRSSGKTYNPFSPIFLQSSSFNDSSNQSNFLLQKGVSFVADGDSKPAKPKSLSSIFRKKTSFIKKDLSSLFAGSSSVSQSKKSPSRPNHVRAENGKRKEYKHPPSGSLSASQSKKRPSRPKHVKAQNGKRKEYNQPSSSICRHPEEDMKRFPEKISPEASALLVRFYEQGYLKVGPDQVPTNRSSRWFIRGAAERFGQQHQDISKWLSGSDLKNVALLGCPSTERKTTLAAKRLRSFFCIQEDIICRGCKLKTSCKFADQKVLKVNEVSLAAVMRLITMLAFDDTPQQLSVPDDVKLSVDKLLKEVVNLSE